MVIEFDNIKSNNNHEICIQRLKFNFLNTNLICFKSCGVGENTLWVTT
jgi:hypothetical protein